MVGSKLPSLDAKNYLSIRNFISKEWYKDNYLVSANDVLLIRGFSCKGTGKAKDLKPKDLYLLGI